MEASSPRQWHDGKVQRFTVIARARGELFRNPEVVVATPQAEWKPRVQMAPLL